MGVEQCVSVVHEAKKKNGQSLLGVGEAWGMVGLGHLLLLCEGRLLMAHFLPHAKSLQHTSSRTIPILRLAGRLHKAVSTLILS